MKPREWWIRFPIPLAYRDFTEVYNRPEPNTIHVIEATPAALAGEEAILLLKTMARYYRDSIPKYCIDEHSDPEVQFMVAAEELVKRAGGE